MNGIQSNVLSNIIHSLKFIIIFLIWCAWRDLNPQNSVSKTDTYANSVTSALVERDKRLELFSTAWKAGAQPIYQSRINGVP